MKKIFLAALCACLLLLSACQSRPREETPSPTPDPTPTPSQTVEASPAPSQPAETPPVQDGVEFPDFLRDFTFLYADTLIPEGDILLFITYQFTPEDRADLKSVIAMDTWWEATDIPAMGLESCDTLYDDEGHSLIFAHWDDEKCLILAKCRGEDEDHLYHAPLSVLEAFERFMADKPFLPDFIRSFEMDQIETGRTLYEDREGYKDCDVYLLGGEEQASFLAALEPNTWALARDVPAMMYTAALTARDPAGNKLVLAPWDEEKCLLICSFTDSYYLYGGPGPVVRYWAPASVLNNVRSLAEGLTPLGVTNNEAALYFDLFRADPGFDVLASLCGDDGRISDDQLAAYALTVLGYEGRINYEIGVPPAKIDAITQKHFGRKVDSYDNYMSKTLPSGNITATGWDANFAACMVLMGEPETDEYGNITATFLQYLLGDELWLDGTMDPARLNHFREYLLTGNDSSGFPRPTRVSITFRIESEEVYGVWREYVVYDAIRSLGI